MLINKFTVVWNHKISIACHVLLLKDLRVVWRCYKKTFHNFKLRRFVLLNFSGCFLVARYLKLANCNNSGIKSHRNNSTLDCYTSAIFSATFVPLLKLRKSTNQGIFCGFYFIEKQFPCWKKM